MKHIQNGSSLVVVMLVMTTLFMSMMLLWKSSVDVLETVYHRERYQQTFYCADMILSYGVLFYKCNQTVLLKSYKRTGRNYHATIQKIPLKQHVYTAELEIEPQKGKACITTRVVSNDGAQCALTCNVIQGDNNNESTVEDWQVVFT